VLRDFGVSDVVLVAITQETDGYIVLNVNTIQGFVCSAKTDITACIAVHNVVKDAQDSAIWRMVDVLSALRGIGVRDAIYVAAIGVRHHA